MASFAPNPATVSHFPTQRYAPSSFAPVSSILALDISARCCAPSPNTRRLSPKVRVQCAGHGSPSCGRHYDVTLTATQNRRPGQHRPHPYDAQLGKASLRSAIARASLSSWLTPFHACPLATASIDAHCPRHAPGPLPEPALSHPARTWMVLTFVRMAFAKTSLIIWPPIPAESECLANSSRRLDYLGGLEHLRISAMPPHLAIQ